jgi:predicted XRE-type DNA-binding protein
VGIGDAPETAASFRARATLIIALQEVVATWKLTQAQAAQRLGVTQPRLNDLLRGRVERFSLDALFDLLSRVDRRVELRVRKAA